MRKRERVWVLNQGLLVLLLYNNTEPRLEQFVYIFGSLDPDAIRLGHNRPYLAINV